MHGVITLRFKISRCCRAASWFWLAVLIRGIRKDLGAPTMPIVIGVLSVDGLNAKGGKVDCAKTFALMGKHFAEANLAMLKQRP